MVGPDGELVGIVTEADFLAARFSLSDQPVARLVGEVMSTPVRTVAASADAAEVARLMTGLGIRCVPVIDRGRLAGIVTRQDFVWALARPDQTLARDVADRLAIFGGRDRWQVSVVDGVAIVVDRDDNENDCAVAAILAEGVPGVIRAECVAAQPRN